MAHGDDSRPVGLGDPFPPPPLLAPSAPASPRPGEMTTGWRIVTACAWVGVIISFAAVWNASVQLGLSTWWLGARAEPQPQFVRLAPFVVPALMCIATFNNVRRLAHLGLVGAAVTAMFGIGDLARVTELAVVELLIAGLVAAVSVASLTGTYRPAVGTDRPETSAG